MTSAKSKVTRLYRNITRCRVCHSDALTECMSFGEQYLASNFVPSNDGHPLAEIKVPLTVALCEGCGLLQLKESVKRDLLYHDYFYRSSTNPMMQAALKDVVDNVSRKAALKKDDYIVDIGCNDCTMLALFPSEYHRIGVEPATNINWGGVDPSIRIINDFFSRKEVARATSGAPC